MNTFMERNLNKLRQRMPTPVYTQNANSYRTSCCMWISCLVDSKIHKYTFFFYSTFFYFFVAWNIRSIYVIVSLFLLPSPKNNNRADQTLNNIITKYDMWFTSSTLFNINNKWRMATICMNPVSQSKNIIYI